METETSNITSLTPLNRESTLSAGAHSYRYAAAVAPGNLPANDNGLLQYWPTLRKHRWTILATIIVVVTIATIVTLRTTPVYEAAGRIAIGHENNDVLGFKSTAEGLTSDSYDYDYTMLDTQIRILQSDAIALATAKALQLDKDPTFNRNAAGSEVLSYSPGVEPSLEAAMMGFVQGGLRLSIVPKTRIIEIRFANPNPQMAAKVVNTLVNVYIEQNFKTKFESAMQTSDWLSKQLSDLQLKVEVSQEKLVRYQREHGILGIDEKQNIVTAKLDELNKELTAAEADRIQKEARYRLAVSGSPELISGSDTTTLLGRLRQQEADLRTQIAQAEVQLGPAHPRIRELNNQLQQVQNNLHSEIEKLAGRIKTDYQTAAQRETLLGGALESQKQQANKLNESAIEYSLLKRDVDTNRQLYEGLLQKLKEASVSAGLRSSNIRVVDVARVPLAPSKPDKRRNIMLAFAMGLVGGVVLAFVLEAVDNTVRTPEQAQAITTLPALGIIPSNDNAMPRTRRQKALAESANAKEGVEVVAYRRPKSDVSESYRALRTAILLSSTGAAPKVMLVTSALPQEGKTTTSINTAVVLAQKGARVLLVDADLRRPSVHKAFNIKPSTGLSTILTGSSRFENTVAQVPQLPNLFLLPAGPPPPHPAELLGSNLMKQCIEQWREHYDHIIFDTPPALSVTDSILLSVDMDAVVLVVRSGSTTKAALRRTRELLAQVNANVLGVVVNAVDVDSPDYYHHYYYGSKYGGYGRYSEDTHA
ncbi:MAG TPA: polysaccharide biosynthesis tyrosine autokinase [Terriglobales bacterium]|nr:polysaccharide biosynthesis tyrosine autokinase [Terriglobales bacterium]